MSGVPVARILGFEVRIHLSWIFIVAIISVTVAGRYGALEPDAGPLMGWLIGVAASFGFLVTVVAHELAHAVVARRHGSEDRAISVHFIGSPAPVDVRAPTPRGELAVAIAGPVVSLVLGIVLIGLAVAGLASNLGGGVRAVSDILFTIGALDLVLGGLSLVPAFPLDGGRIVRAFAWSRSGDPRQGTRAAALVGRWMGRLLLVAGLGVILTGDTINGVMLGLIGWFLDSSARSVDRWATLDALIADVTVDEAMEPDVETLAPQLTLDTFAGSVLDGTVAPALAVLRNDELVGIVGATQIRAVPRRDWPSTRTEQVMVGRADLPTTDPGDSLTEAVERLRRTRLDGLPVFDGAAFRGILTRRSVAAALHRRSESTGVAP